MMMLNVCGIVMVRFEKAETVTFCLIVSFFVSRLCNHQAETFYIRQWSTAYLIGESNEACTKNLRYRCDNHSGASNFKLTTSRMVCLISTVAPINLHRDPLLFDTRIK